jgi:phosphocarrier protein HPr
VDANSILAVMGLGARHGERVVLQADGDGADDALDRLAALLSQDLDHAE